MKRTGLSNGDLLFCRANSLILAFSVGVGHGLFYGEMGLLHYPRHEAWNDPIIAWYIWNHDTSMTRYVPHVEISLMSQP